MNASGDRVVDFEKKRQERDAAKSGAQPSLPLYGGGGPTDMEPTPNWKEYIDAKDEALESRVHLQLKSLATSKEVRNNVWGGVAALLGIGLAILAFGGDRFDGGMSASALLKQQAEIQGQKDADQDARLQVMDQKLDILIRQTAKQ